MYAAFASAAAGGNVAGHLAVRREGNTHVSLKVVHLGAQAPSFPSSPSSQGPAHQQAVYLPWDFQKHAKQAGAGAGGFWGERSWHYCAPVHLSCSIHQSVAVHRQLEKCRRHARLAGRCWRFKILPACNCVHNAGARMHAHAYTHMHTHTHTHARPLQAC